MAEEDRKLQHSSCSGELIPGILNEITLGPIVGRMAFYTKCRLATLNRDWLNALMNPDPALAKFYADYSRRLNPRPLTNPNSILVHTYTLNCFPYWACPMRQSLNIYQGGTLTSLPFPNQILADFRDYLRFAVADNRIYSLVPTFAGHYVVSVLDLCRGTLCFHWERLATITIPEGGSVCSSTLTTQDGTSSITSIWAYKTGPDNPRNLSHWRHTFVSDEQGKWEEIRPPSPPPLPNGELPPKYVEIFDKEKKLRYLYKRDTCTRLIFPSQGISVCQSHWPEHMLVVFKDDYNANTGELNAMHRVIITARSCSDCYCDINLQRMCLKDQSAELIVDNEELTTFQKDWPRFISQSEIDLHGFMKISVDSFNSGCKEWEGQFSLPVCDTGNEQTLSYISLTQEEIIIVYRRIATKPECGRTYLSELLSQVVIKMGFIQCDE